MAQSMDFDLIMFIYLSFGGFGSRTVLCVIRMLLAEKWGQNLNSVRSSISLQSIETVRFFRHYSCRSSNSILDRWLVGVFLCVPCRRWVPVRVWHFHGKMPRTRGLARWNPWALSIDSAMFWMRHEFVGIFWMDVMLVDVTIVPFYPWNGTALQSNRQFADSFSTSTVSAFCTLPLLSIQPSKLRTRHNSIDPSKQSEPMHGPNQ